MNDIDAVIFDLDGTLYDKSRLVKYLIVKQSLRFRLGMLARERKARAALSGLAFPSEDAFYDAFYARLSDHRPAAEKWYRRYLADMAQILWKHYSLREWVKPLLNELHARGIPVAVISDYGAVREKLEALDFPLAEAACLMDAANGGGLKPYPGAFLKAAEKLGVDPSRCLVVGDRADKDGAAAEAAGMPFRLIDGDRRPF